MIGMTIGALAEAGDVGVETIRFYQRRNLLRTPERETGGGLGGHVRRYDEADLNALRFIRSAQAAGFTLAEIAELLALDPIAERTRAAELARERINALDAKIAELQTVRASLARLHQSCTSGEAGACPILVAFESEGESARMEFKAPDRPRRR